MDGTPVHFYRQGTRGSYSACAATVESWQSVSIACTSCGARYIAGVARRDPSHNAAAVAAYLDVTGQMLLASRALIGECPDHGFRVRVRAFSIVA